MDLFLSGQSMLAMSVLALLSTAIAWLAARARARRRAGRHRLDGAGSLAELRAGRPAKLAGVLRVDGAMCSRFEDAHPVAATSYRQPAPTRGELARTWHARADALHLEVEGVRIELEGPLVVARGSCEWMPGGGLETLRDRVRDRVYASEVALSGAARGDGRDHVFRSLEPGDEVVVEGVAARAVDADGPASYRQHGGGWKLVAAEAALVARYQGRPELRAQLGRTPLYAAAACVGVAALLASFIAGTQPACSDRREACALYGLCGTRLEQRGAELSVACVAPSSEDCERSLSCRKLGLCSRAPWGQCMAASDADCRSSLACHLHGRCSAGVDGECIAASPDDCDRSVRCREGCSLQAGACLPRTESLQPR